MPVPSEIRANFDFSFSVEDAAADVPALYTPKFVLAGSSSLVDSGTVSGDDIVFALTASQTASFASGIYRYQVIADLAAARVLIAEGTVNVIKAMATTGVQDFRTTAESIVDAIDAMMAGKATADQQSYVIQTQLGSRSLSRMSMEDLLKARQYYRSLVLTEQRIRDGVSPFKQYTWSPSRVL